jgi:hypothetical protein
MLRSVKSRLGYANVVSTLAPFLALGGSAIAVSQINGGLLKNRSVAGKKLKKDSVTGVEVREATLGKVPKAAHADSATTANSATNATYAANADTATNARSADTAMQLTLPAEYTQLTLDTANGWTDASAPGAGHVTAQPLGFYIDREGFVHLEGAVENPSSTSTAAHGEIAQLPPGARPGGTAAANDLTFPAAFGGNTVDVVDIEGPGFISADKGDTRFISLEGIEFPARG